MQNNSELTYKKTFYVTKNFGYEIKYNTMPNLVI